LPELKQTARLACLLGLLFLAGCGTGKDSAQDRSPLLPFPYEDVQDLSDDVLIESIKSMMQGRNGPQNSRFAYTRIDLDGDNRKDALVFMKTPYRYWCGQYGCTLFVMRAGAEDFDYVAHVTPIRPPFLVGRGTTNGWRDLIVTVDGRWSETKTVALQYDGRSYPRNPEDAPPITQYAAIDGVKVFP
jgi:hypothetical protein